jgi:peptide/nickel transport system permease protein
MAQYLIKRILISIVVFFGITIGVFFLSYMAPGSPIQMLTDPTMTTERVEELEQSFGLDQPIYVQYGKWLSELLHGNFGYSYASQTPVGDILSQRMQPTLILMITSIVLAVIIAIPLGILSAYKPYSIFDYISSGIAFLGAGIPTFFISLICIYVFSVQLNILPITGMNTAGVNSLADTLKHMIMPVGVLTFSMLGSLVRQARSSMLEVINDDYIRTARAKGLTESKVLFKHAFRNALIPIVTQIGTTIPYIIGGSVVIEQMFGWAGIGSLLVTAISQRDYPIIMAVTVVISVAVLICNILIDIIYTILDPRIKYA